MSISKLISKLEVTQSKINKIKYFMEKEVSNSGGVSVVLKTTSNQSIFYSDKLISLNVKEVVELEFKHLNTSLNKTLDAIEELRKST